MKNTTSKQYAGNAENTNNKNFNSEQLIEYKEVENTPFVMVKMENTYFGVLANKRITEVFESAEELENDLREITWNKIVQLLWVFNEKQANLKIKDNE